MNRDSHQYLSEFLGSQSYEKVGKSSGWFNIPLPAWITTGAEIELIAFEKVKVLFLEPKEGLTSQQIVQMARVCQKSTSHLVMIVADKLERTARSHLVRARIPMLVTRRMVFAPELGLYVKGLLDENEKSINKTEISRLTPSAQRILVAALLHYERFEGKVLTLGELHQLIENTGIGENKKQYEPGFSFFALGEISQGVKILSQKNALEVARKKTALCIEFVEREALWRILNQFHTNIVSKQVFTGEKIPGELLKSGESALSELTDLSEPESPTFAVYGREIRRSKSFLKPTPQRANCLRKASSSTAILEFWRIDPRFAAEKGCINTIELALTLKTNDDPRVKIAVSDLLKKYELKASMMWGET